MLTIRRAVDEDAETLSRLGAATFVETFGHLYAAEDLSAFLKKSHSIDAYRAAVADPETGVWLGEDESGRALGYAVAGPCGLPAPDMPPKSGELGRLYLLQEAQGTGSGGLLLGTAMEFLASNFEHVYLSVYAENFRAQKVYARRGFVKVFDYFYMVGNHADPEWVMKLAPGTPADEFGRPA